ncbi:MAG: glutamate racemase [Micavibrio sp.]|nr:glutamate racemase [Micavibrio sp.]|tara:strand:+ start:1345 stop:2145 length:801 start_codon:yes stop_codon:yes gene_type:complete
MKIGVFDSGLGGLLIAKEIRKQLPDYDYVYFGDTLHLPYGVRSMDTIYGYCEKIVDYLFRVQNCQIIIVACNTASAAALRRLQQEYLPTHFPDRRILGVVIPMLEEADDSNIKNLGLIATNYMVGSGIYQEELRKIDPEIEIHQKATPLLVPLIEYEGDEWIDSVLQSYLQPLVEKGIKGLILGCTHYAILEEKLAKLLPENVTILSQHKIIPLKLTDYLQRHPEIETKLTKNNHVSYLLSDITPSYILASERLMQEKITLQKVVL